MTRLSPDALRALRLIVDAEGDFCSADVGAHLYPLPRLTRSADYLAWRAARPRLEAARDAKASRLVRRLAEYGYVESGPPVVSAWFRERWTRRAAHIREDWRALGYPEAPTPEAAESDALLLLVGSTLTATLVRRVLELSHRDPAKGPTSVADIIGPRPSGATKRAWRELDRAGIVVTPSRRRATAKGIALIRRLPCGCAPSEDCERCKFP